MGLEPTTTRITIADSTVELRPPLKTRELPVMRTSTAYPPNRTNSMICQAPLVYTRPLAYRYHNSVMREAFAFRINRLRFA